MTIQKKLLVSNILLILIPIVFCAVFGMIVFDKIGNRHWIALENMFRSETNVYSAQSLLYAYSFELENYDWKDYFIITDGNKKYTQEKYGYPFFAQTQMLNRLESDLKNLGYSFRVVRDEQIVYNTLKNSTALYTFIEQTESRENALVTNPANSFIKQTHNNVTIYAMYDSPDHPSETTYLRRYIFSIIIYFFLFLLFMIIAVNTVISKINEKMILTPLKKLQYATEEIKNGNFDIQIDYTKDDEFLRLCESFDDMRKHLKDSVQERLETEEYRKTLIADISHDLRTPLTSMKGYIEGLIDNIAQTKEKREQYYKAIYTSTLDLENLVDNLTVLSKMDTKSFVYNKTETNIISYIDTFARSRQEEMQQKNILLQVRHESTYPISVYIDEDEFVRVILNITENSFAYRVRDSVCITIATKQKDDTVIISISDDGNGVQEKSLDKIFHRFYREDKSRSQFSGEHGLGLAIVKQIILGHDGNVYAENDGGLKIIITLPVIKNQLLPQKQ